MSNYPLFLYVFEPKMVKKQRKKKVNQTAMKASQSAVPEEVLEGAPEVPGVPDEELPEIDYNQPSSS